MANYRFKTAEIEAMKKSILTHIEHETETKTAWRLRCAIEGQLMCCCPSKREAARLERELALYEKLTENDLPNWQSEPTQPATPTETTRISTETAEAVNVSAEGENTAERAFISMCVKHHKKHAPAYSHYSLYRYNDTMFAFGKEAEMAREYFQNNKYCPLSEVEREHNGEKYLCFHVSHYNGDVKGRIRDLMEQRHIAEYGTPSNGLITVWDAEEVEYCSRNVTPIEPPQSPETPQVIKRTTDTPKPRETARKPQNRGICNTRHSGLGVNGYAMLDNASATLTAMHVPRECSTVDAACW